MSDTLNEPGEVAEVYSANQFADLDGGDELRMDDAPFLDASPFGDTGDDYPDATSLSLWEGDEGHLTLPQRRTMVALLKNRFISASKHAEEWRTLVEDETPFRSWLNDVFLELIVDYHHQVAFKRQAVPEGGARPFPTLLYDQGFSREETILLVYLRMRFRHDYGDTDKVFVDRDEMLDQVAHFRPATATNVSGDTKKTANAIEVIRRAGILIGKQDTERFQISPIIDVLLSEARLEQLLGWFISTNGDLEDTDPSGASEPAEGLFDDEERIT